MNCRLAGNFSDNDNDNLSIDLLESVFVEHRRQENLVAEAVKDLAQQKNDIQL